MDAPLYLPFRKTQNKILSLVAQTAVWYLEHNDSGRQQVRFTTQDGDSLSDWYPSLFFSCLLHHFDVTHLKQDLWMPHLAMWDRPYGIVLIQAGNAILGRCHHERVVEYKHIRKYMVRKKQGVAQINKRKERGRQNLGSRIRLAQTKQFIEEIQHIIARWTILPVDFIFYSCSKTLWGPLFNMGDGLPLSKKDPRWIKIPKHIPTPNRAVFSKTKRWLTTSAWVDTKEDGNILPPSPR